MTANTAFHVDKATRNRIYFSLYGAVFSAMIGVGIVIPLLPRYAVTLGATGIWIGAIFSAFAISRLIFLPLFGKISDTIGRKRLIVYGLCAYTVLSLLYLLAGSVYEITALRFFHGMASAMILPIALAYINDIAPIGEEGKFIGSFVSSIYLGMSFGPFIGGVIMDLLSMNAVFFAMAFFSLLALVTSILYLPDIQTGPGIKTSFREIIFHKNLQGPVLYQLMYALANGTFMVFLPILAIQDPLISASEIGVIILVSVLTTPIFQHFFSRIADSFRRYHLIALGVTMIGASLLVIPVVQGLSAYLLSAVLLGVGRGISLPSLFALVSCAGREIGQGSASGMVNMSLAIGLIVAPLLSGVIMDLSGIDMVFYVSGVMSLFCTGIFIRLNNREERSENPMTC
ncbi:MFS transporter [Methanospirillum sp. J.3.6.1-F.2.7.3]|uniref:MFS transporter n=1 Tax=Methanospirillum purgamenti TaxID=2834276 RepID=A0A8E7AZY2_9EURY|nr:MULTISPECIES: MFS transporter [Methanospirillum]MDX8550580.1 MFS transporter [Methanospirillum hungatei]QVV88314.1 MFS transporter [Methanospirillum sp. J.3.6.1-F.2.7.3]